MASIHKEVTKKKPTKSAKIIAKAKKKPAVKIKKKAAAKKPLKPAKRLVKKAKPTIKATAQKKKTVPAKPKTAKTAVKKTAQKALAVKVKAPSKATTKKISTPAKILPETPKRSNQPETLIGAVTHYYAQIGVAVARIDSKSLSIGDTIHVKGHTTDFTQTVDSMEIDHEPIKQANTGDEFGLKVLQHVRVGDAVYKVNG